MNLLSEYYKAAHWISTYLACAGKTHLVVGLSGGIDSALAAAMAVEAIGADKVIGVAMPCHSSPDDLNDALLVAKHLGIEFKVVDLSAWFDASPRTLSKEEIQALPRDQQSAALLRMANIKARLRMLTLYDIAAGNTALVLGTCNKSEVDIGYETKYGDGGCDLNPLGDFYKTEVWKIARLIGLPDRIISRVPSAGLWDGQTDEGELGMSYAELDPILMTIAAGQEPSCEQGRANYVMGLIVTSGHKRNMPPVFERTAA